MHIIIRGALKIRYMIDASMIYSLRELLISITNQNIDYLRLIAILGVIFVLFIFRYMSIKITYISNSN